MTMVVSHNSSAQMALGELQKNNNKLSKASRQAASGVKIGGAGDGASEYSISEKMRVQIRGLEQDIANAQTGTNLIKTAEGGIQDIIDNLRSLKELALNAANDHNTDLDRETIQKEVNSRLATIDDIASTTSYNGKLLLNGDYGMLKQTNATSPTEPTGTAIIMTNGDYTIANDGIYMMPTGYQGRITITAANVKIVQQDSSDVHNYTAIECTFEGTNLWLDDVKIHNGLNAAGFYDLSGQRNNNVVKFNGSGNTLNIRNDVQLINGNTPDGNNSENAICRYYSAINTGGGLTINGIGSNSSLKAKLDDNGGGYNCEAAAIGSNHDQQLTGDIVINGLSYLEASSEWGAGIGAGQQGRVGNIAINGVEEIRVGIRAGAGIGSAPNGQVGNININDVKRLYGSTGNYDGPGTVIGNHNGTNGTININADYIFLACKPATASVGTFSTGNDTSGTTITAPATINGSPFNPNGNSYVANPTQYPNSQVFEYVGSAAPSNISDTAIDLRGLIIHTGTKANQNLRVIINSMDTGTLGIDPLPVNPLEAAVSSLSAIDSAIDYSLNENTRMGAYQMKLSYTIDNLVTASENTQGSESVIRDADMAKTMMEHAKYNILSQSAQAMLAQANQNSSGVLNLLQ